jgi:hypothetical protein
MRKKEIKKVLSSIHKVSSSVDAQRFSWYWINYLEQGNTGKDARNLDAEKRYRRSVGFGLS